MISTSVEPRPWPRRRWWGMVALIFIGQLLLIFWLGSRTPIRPRLPTGALTLHLGGHTSSELQALNDPTLVYSAAPARSLQPGLVENAASRSPPLCVGCSDQPAAVAA